MNLCPICKKKAISFGERIFLSSTSNIICKQCGSTLKFPDWYKKHAYLQSLIFFLLYAAFKGIIELVYHMPFHDYFVYRVIFIVFLVVLMLFIDYVKVPLKLNDDIGN